jgi:hypothetical protein
MITNSVAQVEPLPDLDFLARPSVLNDVAASMLFGFGGLFIGGELGLLGGGAMAGRTITQDPAQRDRIQSAFNLFRADALRHEASQLERLAKLHEPSSILGN